MAEPLINHAKIAEDAAEVTKRILASAANFDEGAASLSLTERLAMSPAEHCAWAVRFAPDQADPRTIMALHGRS